MRAAAPSSPRASEESGWRISSLKRLKEDAREVAAGLECGIGVENYGEVKPGDVLEVYDLEEIRPSLD